ncbi:hypothetical protein C8T65DRAFT_286045 [Cerioporus squamosus]|nr:hypothetical protein C8T65DRAFT_286045 [Cerioporus squamosus]
MALHDPRWYPLRHARLPTPRLLPPQGQRKHHVGRRTLNVFEMFQCWVCMIIDSGREENWKDPRWDLYSLLRRVQTSLAQREGKAQDASLLRSILSARVITSNVSQILRDLRRCWATAQLAHAEALLLHGARGTILGRAVREEGPLNVPRSGIFAASLCTSRSPAVIEVLVDDTVVMEGTRARVFSATYSAIKFKVKTALTDPPPPPPPPPLKPLWKSGALSLPVFPVTQMPRPSFRSPRTMDCSRSGNDTSS